MRWAPAALLCWLALAPSPARAHSLEFGVLRATENATGASLHLQLETTSGRELGFLVGGACRQAGESSITRAAGRVTLRSELACEGGLDAAEIGLDGLDEQQVLLLVSRRDGRTTRALLSRESPSLVLAAAPSSGDTFAQYLEIGAAHVAVGFDHLLFLFALLLVVLSVRSERRARLGLLAKTVTGFTVGHAVTITLAGLGSLSLSSAPVEACIALSIVWLSAELIRADRGTLTQRYPWAVAASFGLLHGLGFAGALSEVGLRPGQELLSLLGFNLGVEGAQLALGLVMFGFAHLAGAARSASARRRIAYVIGTVAVVFTTQRVDGLFSSIPL